MRPSSDFLLLFNSFFFFFTEKEQNILTLLGIFFPLLSAYGFCVEFIRFFWFSFRWILFIFFNLLPFRRPGAWGPEGREGGTRDEISPLDGRAGAPFRVTCLRYACGLDDHTVDGSEENAACVAGRRLLHVSVFLNTRPPSPLLTRMNFRTVFVFSLRFLPPSCFLPVSCRSSLPLSLSLSLSVYLSLSPPHAD